MHWFRRARVTSAVLIAVVTGVGLLTQIGERPRRHIATTCLLLAGAVGLPALYMWVDTRLLD